MRGTDANRFPDLRYPLAGDPGRLVNMAVHCESWLPPLDKATYGNTADVYVERRMIHKLAIQGGAVERGIVRR